MASINGVHYCSELMASINGRNLWRPLMDTIINVALCCINAALMSALIDAINGIRHL
jgi:hypothetical protein